MKRTHFSVGLYEPVYRLPRRRQKHLTVCGTTCSATKATTEPARVTCMICKKKIEQKLDSTAKVL